LATTSKAIDRTGRSAWTPALFVAPAIVWVLAFTIFPVLYSLPSSFQERYRTAESREMKTRWVGLANYRRALGNPEIRHSIAFTSAVIALSVGGEVGLGLVLALAAHGSLRRRRGWPVAVFILPMLAAPVAIAFLSLTVFEPRAGLVNLVLGLFLPTEALPAWRSGLAFSTMAIVAVDWWQWTPFCFLILLGARATVPEDVVEAASVEGATAWTVARSVLLPMMTPALLTVTSIRLIEALKIFDVPYVLTGGGPGVTTYTYTQWVWRIGLRDGNYELAAALGYLLLIPVVAAAMFLVRTVGSRQQAVGSRQ
jgi:multiple sugar transport system permease protein